MSVAGEHSPEPWSVRPPDLPKVDTGEIYDANNVHIGCTYKKAYTSATGKWTVIPAVANARRIVACLKTLRGVPTETLESGVFRDELLRLGLVEMGDG